MFRSAIRFCVLPMSSGSLVAVHIVHGVTVKFLPVFRRTLAPARQRPAIALAIVEMMVHVPIEMIRPMEPWSGADENPSGEPFRAIVTIRSTAIGRGLIIAVWTNRWSTDTNRNLRGRFMTGSYEETYRR